MLKEQSVRLQEVPLIRRCHSCRQLKFAMVSDRPSAIASQVLIHKPSGRPYCRWLCESCGHKRGLHPAPDYLKNLQEMDEGDERGIHELTLQEYLDTKPKVTRLFHHYSHEERCVRAGSQRLGHQERDAVGHYFYTIQGVKGVCFESPSQARGAAHRQAVETALKQKRRVPGPVLWDYPWLQTTATRQY